MGEKGVFTDQDNANFKKLLGPGLVLSTTDPQLAHKQIGDIRGLLDQVTERNLKSATKVHRAMPSQEATTPTL